jgi:hypothetical protein
VKSKVRVAICDRCRSRSWAGQTAPVRSRRRIASYEETSCSIVASSNQIDSLASANLSPSLTSQALLPAFDYRAFEGTIIADYDAQSAVERELVLRLASLLWRLRRATTMETGLFEIQAEQLRDYRQAI